MAKRITITLSDKAEKYFNELMYSLDKGDGKMPTQSEAINWALEACEDFESNAGQDIVGWLQDNYSVYTTTGRKD